MPVERLLSINDEIKDILNNNLNLKYFPKIIVVCKTFSMDKILPLINHGHIHFAENKVQEAETKWPDTKKKFPQIKLHMVGKLQTNKVKKAVELFDYIHSVDTLKLAEKISKYKLILKKEPKIFIQVNVGEESQKSGVTLEEVLNFVHVCKNDLSLHVTGLMCLPPNNVDVEKYFKMLFSLREKAKVDHLSMGMSNDYKVAVKCGSTFLRIGTKILGERFKV